MSVDLLGGVFNDLSLAFKADFDVVAGVTYSLVVVCVIGAVSALIAAVNCVLTAHGRHCHPVRPHLEPIGQAPEKTRSGCSEQCRACTTSRRKQQ